MKYQVLIVLSLLLVSGCVTTVNQREPEKLWPLVAKSDVIVTGTLKVPVDSIRSNLRSKQHNYVELSVIRDQVLKGNVPESFSVRCYTRPDDYSPHPERIIALNGEKVLLFLAYIDKNFYFTGHTPRALSLPEAGLIDKAQHEISAQQDILKHFEEEFVPSKTPLYTQVKKLIDKTTQKDSQMTAFLELEKLGPKAVPAIIMLMDDRRDLAIPAISLENSPDHWEGIRHYGPEKVVDAMAAILNQITYESFRPIYNGGTEKEREEAVNGWRIYLYYLNKEPHDNKVQSGFL